MIIIEGSDLVGKTTLAKKLERLPQLQSEGMVYRHLSKLPAGFNHPLQYLELSGRRCIYDRFHMSEPCYCYARKEPESLLDPEGYRLIDAHLRMLGAYTVVVTAEPQLLAGRYVARASMEMYDQQTVMRANEAFTKIMNGQRLFSERVAYLPDYDEWLRCTEAVPFVTDDMVEKIAQGYLARQARLYVFNRNRRDYAI